MPAYDSLESVMSAGCHRPVTRSSPNVHPGNLRVMHRNFLLKSNGLFAAIQSDTVTVLCLVHNLKT